MSAREVIVLGTSSQVPTRERNHNACFLRWDELGILFDPGEGTQRQMTHAGIAASQITHIAITHFHGDHSLGLASMLQRISLDAVEHPIEVFYPASGQVFFERLRYATIYWERGKIVPRPVESPGTGERVIAKTASATLVARALDHRVDCIGYRLVEDDGHRMLPEKLRALGVRGPAVGELARTGALEVDGREVTLADVSEPRRGQVFAFVMDTRPCDGARRLAERADLVVCESTYLDAERDEAYEHHHMTSVDAAKLAAEAGARRLVLTHFSQRYVDVGAFAREAKVHHSDVVAARDLTVVSVPKREGA